MDATIVEKLQLLVDTLMLALGVYGILTLDQMADDIEDIEEDMNNEAG